MRYKILSIITVVMICGCAIWGGVEKQSYSQILEEENYLNNFQVAEFPDELIQDVAEDMRNSLPESEYIIKVMSTGKTRNIFKCYMQEVIVEKIYRGEGIEENEKIYIMKPGWQYYFDDMTVNMGFVNRMERNEEYLVFLNERADSSLDKEVDHEVYYLNDDIISPVFCYNEKENVIVETGNESRYVDYIEVKNNEFFLSSQDAIDIMLEIKQEMLKKYS